MFDNRSEREAFSEVMTVVKEVKAIKVDLGMEVVINYEAWQYMVK